MQQSQRDRRGRSGLVLVEAALVLPFVILVIVGILEYGRYLMTVNLFNNAVRQGAEYAAKHTDPIVLGGTTYNNGTSDVVNVVNSYLAGQQLKSQNISVYLSDSVGNNLGTWTSAQPGQYVCVQITGVFNFVAPTLIYAPAAVNLTLQAVTRSEGN
jgi:Flp pilus assembly protein TadG